MRQHLLAMAALALLPSAMSAQAFGPASAIADIRANILSPLTLTRAGTTDFGNFDGVSHVETINPVNPGTKSTALFTAAGSANISIVISFDPTVPICIQSGGCGVASMTFTPNVAASQTNTQASATPGLASGTAVALSATGNGYFWLGGSLQVNANQRPGQYSGTFTLSAAYQ
jgi:hypothetical protein